jgi:iron complex transport system ATP-binding protein
MAQRPRLPSIISLNGVGLEYEGKSALRLVDWEVGHGESWVVIGPNGAGKTSLLSIINGYRWPTTGEVEVLGERFGESDLRELRKHVGLVSAFLEEWIPPDERVLDLVVSGKYGATRMWRSVGPAERRRAESLLSSMGCAEHARKRVNELSQGERQKVMIARMLMSETKLLVLDEPCEGLDLGARESFLASVSRLAKERSVAIIYVTHRTDEIPAGFTHVLLLKAGRVMASGKIDDVLTGANLSRCFGVRVRLHKVSGRYYSIVESKP